MTSDVTDAPTRAFFDEKEYFGLDESQVKPFLAFQKIADYGVVHFSMFFRIRSLFIGCDHASIVPKGCVIIMLQASQGVE